MTTESQETVCEANSANIAHGVSPPPTAKWKRPLVATASRARAATKSAPARATASGSARDSTSWCMSDLLLLGVAAEFAAHRRQDLVGELSELTRLESLVERRRDDRYRHPLVDGGEHGPPTLPGIGDPSGEVVEIGRARERVGGQINQPRPDDRAPPPDLCHLTGVDVVLIGPRIAQRCGLGVDDPGDVAGVGLLDHTESLGDRGHHAVLDSIVNHLHEVSRAARAAMSVPVG